MIPCPRTLWLQLIVAILGGSLLGASGDVIAIRLSVDYWARVYPHDGQIGLGVMAVAVFSFLPLAIVFSVAIFVLERLRRPQIIIFIGCSIVGFASWQLLVYSRILKHWNLVGLFALSCLVCLFGATQSIALPLVTKYSQVRRERSRGLLL